MIGIHILPEQRDLSRAQGHQALGFRNHGGGGAGIFRAARVRHHAEGTEFVAAFLHGQERGHALRRGLFRQMIEFPIHREFGFNHSAGRAGGTRHHLRQAVIALGAEHNIHPRRAGSDFRPFRLRDTARHRDNHLPATRHLGFAQPAEIGKHLLGRFFADMAGIEDDHIGILRRLRWRIAKGCEHIGHARTVINIHLAAPGADQKPLPGRGAGCISHGNKPLPPQGSGAK